MGVEYLDADGDGPGARKRWIRNAIISVVVVVLVFAAWRMTNARRVNRSLAALRSAGYPTTLAEVERLYYPAIPTADNAATYYAQAFGLLRQTNKPTGSWWFFGKLARTGELWPSNDLAKVVRAIEENQPYMDALRSNYPTKGSRYPINLSKGLGLTLSHLNPISEAGRFLVADAALKADVDNTEAALEDLDAAFRLSQSLQNEPIISSQLVRMRFRLMISSCVERMLSHGALTDGQLTRLATAFANDDTSGGMERALAMELCTGTMCFQMSAREQAAFFARPDPGSGGTQPGPSALVAGQNLMRFSGLVDRDFEFYLRCMTEHLRISKVPFPERLDEANGLDERMGEQIRRGYHLYSSALLPALTGLAARDAENVARLNIIQAVLAIERYRVANEGKVPEHLKDVTPAYLAAIPKDPFDGGPLRYRKLERGYVVYSIGRNRKDDGGSDTTTDRRQMKDDVTFTVGK